MIDRDRDRPAHAIGRDHERDTGPRASLDIDRIVADAEPRHDGEPAAFRHAARVEAVGQEDQGIDLLELVGPEGIGVVQIRDPDAGCVA